MSSDWVDGIAVFVLGALVGIGELVARYRDEPTRAITTRPAMLYVAVNGLASLFALVAIVTFNWRPSATASNEELRLLRIIAAGFGALALFRTSLFVVRVGSTDVGVGPIAFLQIILGATDRGVDRKRASDRANRVVRIMGDLDFETVYKALPAFAIMLMQNLTLEDQKAIGDQVTALAEAQTDAKAKVLNLGLLLMNFVGEEVLDDAVTGIKGQLKLGPRWSGLLAKRQDGEAVEPEKPVNASVGTNTPSLPAASGQELGTEAPDGPPPQEGTVVAELPSAQAGQGLGTDPVKHDEASTPPAGTSAPGTAVPRAAKD
jgi:hypothetical protein